MTGTPALDKTRPDADRLLALAIDVPIWLERDQATEFSARHERDRAALGAATELGPAPTDQSAAHLVQRWWSGLSAAEFSRVQNLDDDGGPLPGRRAQSVRVLLTSLLVIVMVLAGTGLGAAVFRYDGSHPINALLAFGLLVALQALLLLLSALLMPGRLPGLGWLREAASAINVGVLIGALFRRLGARGGGVAEHMGWHGSRARAVMGFGKWQSLTWSHLAALSFNAGALAMAFALVALTDLAFGWSTTLALDASAVHRAVEVIALPWGAWLPGAVPDLATVEATRYFRADTAAATDTPMSLTGWWPFLLMSMIVYVIGPRLVLLCICLRQLRLATVRLLVDDARVRALIDRLVTPSVAKHALESDHGPAAPAAAVPLSSRAATTTAVTVLNWSRAASEEQVRAVLSNGFGLAVASQYDVGGARSVAEDAAVIESIRGAQPARVVLLGKAWEPPILDVRDFLGDLRDALGGDCSIMVVPLAEDPDEVPSAQFVGVWERSVAALADPATYVQARPAVADGAGKRADGGSDDHRDSKARDQTGETR